MKETFSIPFVNRYINIFFKTQTKKKEIENEFNELDIFELIKNNKYDYLNYTKKLLDQITNSKIS